MSWIDIKDKLPKPNHPVLAVSGKYILRAAYIPKFYLKVDDAEWGVNSNLDFDYNEENDTEYWPEGWYEWNEWDETHWVASGTVTHWMELPAMPGEERRNYGI